MKRTVLCILLSLLVFLTPLFSLFGMAFLTPSVYDESFVGVLDEKVERLYTLEKSKIVIIGGSSVAFGIDSELLSEQTGKEVVNFGLYAALGTKVMLDLSRRGIHRGDTVILMPEADAQTMSLYFNAEMAWRAIEDKPSLLFSLPIDNVLSMLGSLYHFVQDKCAYLREGKKSRTNDIYAAENFNEYGDLAAYRGANTMTGGVDQNGKITLGEDLLSDDFIAYVNDYIAYCQKKGATVYFGYCPMNEAALTDKSDAALDAYAALLQEKFSCPFLGDVHDAVMDKGYFYDTNFHLNSIGAENHTLLLARDYWATKGTDFDVTALLLDPPALPCVEYDIEMDNPASLSDFELEENLWYNPATGENEFAGYVIVGLTEEGKTKTTLTVPVCKDGRRVCLLSGGALAGGAVETLILPEELSMGFDGAFVLEDGFADGASSLSSVHSLLKNGTELRPPSSWPVGVTLFVTPDAENYSSYNWSKLQNLVVKTTE